MKNLKKLTYVLAGVLLTMALSTIVSAANEFPTTDTAAMFGLGMAICAVFAIIWLIVWILVAIWVYKDAEKRGKNGVLWLIIVILLGIIGLIIWLVVRGEKSGTTAERRCPACGRTIPMDARVCPYCNKKFEE